MNEPPDPSASAGKSRNRLWLISAGVILACGAGWLLYAGTHEGVAQASVAAPLPQVEVSAPLVRNVDTTLTVLGQFSAVDQVDIHAQVGGTLTGISFTDGAIVHKGDLLFTIDSSSYDIKLAEATAQLETATAQLALAKRELSRAVTLQQTNAGTAENVDQKTYDARAAQAAVDNATATVRDAKFDVDHCIVRAPFTGRIGKHLVSIGNLVAGSRTASSPTTLLATLVSLDPVYVDFDMSETDLITYSSYRQHMKGAANDQVDLTLDDDPQYERKGTLDFVDNALDPSSGTIRARATVPNADLFLTPGEFAHVNVVVAPPAPALLVPDAAVLPDQSNHLVLTVSKQGLVVPKPVQIGEMRGGLRVVQSGLLPGDRVIIGGLPYAMPGAKVATHNGTISYSATAAN